MRTKLGVRVTSRIGLVVGTLLCAGLLFAACGGGGSDSSGGYTPPKGPSVQTLDIHAGNFYFKPKTIDAKPGITTIKLTDDGGIHTLVFANAFSGLQLEITSAGETSTGKVDLQPGKYTFYCNITGHRAQGMEGTITVK